MALGLILIEFKINSLHVDWLTKEVEKFAANFILGELTSDKETHRMDTKAI
jgi:hypothetical protein